MGVRRREEGGRGDGVQGQVPNACKRLQSAEGTMHEESALCTKVGCHGRCADIFELKSLDKYIRECIEYLYLYLSIYLCM